MLPQHSICDFSKEQYGSLKMIFRIETCWSDFKCLSVKFYISALVGIIQVGVQLISDNTPTQLGPPSIFPASKVFSMQMTGPSLR